MKVKILESSDWYKHFVGSEFEVDQYVVDDYLGIHIEDASWIYRPHCVITELPKSFCVKRCDDGIKWGKYIQWLNKTYESEFDGNHWEYYGIWENGFYCNDEPFGTEIHIDDMIKHIDYMERHINGGEQFSKESQLIVKMDKIIKEETNMNTQKLSRKGLKEIHSIACSSWKNTLERYGSRNPLEDYIELYQEEVDKMFRACTKEQLPIVSKYLKQNDGSVDIMKFKCEIYDKDGRAVIEKRFDGEYGHKSLLLDDAYNWEIKKDSKGYLCLIPTKKEIKDNKI
jgi:hypothetical protein